MNKGERTKKKLIKLKDDDWLIAMKKCDALIKHRVGRRTKTGCHSEEYLGEPAFDYYFNQAIDKLYSGTWEWKDEYSFSEQICRIVGSIISENVRKYKMKPEKKEVLFNDIAYYFGVDFNEDAKVEEREEIYEIQLNTIAQAIDGNSDMETLLIHIMDKKTNDEICEVTNWKKEKLYKLTNKMKNKTKKYIAKQSKEIAK